MAAIMAAVTLVSAGCSTAVDGSAQVAIGVMPDILGMTERDALRALSEAGPWGYVLQETPSDIVPPGHVAKFGPPAGTQLPLNHPVGVMISSGPEQN